MTQEVQGVEDRSRRAEELPRQEEAEGEGQAAGDAHADPKPNTPGAPRTPDRPGIVARSRRDADARTPSPGATPGAHGHATPTATPVYPSRTGVDLDEWVVRSSYRTLAAGVIDFNAANLGEDDHNLSMRGGATEYGRLDLAPGDADTLKVSLAPGTYTLYCSLPGHEEQGMRTDITVR